MRIWFNRGYSLAPIAAAMIASDPTLEVYASVAPGKPVYPGPTLTLLEPLKSEAAYVEWVREHILIHKIDVFIPTYRRRALMEALLPCRVETPADPYTLNELADKFAFAKTVAAERYHLPTQLIASSSDLSHALDQFAIDYPNGQPCVKPRNGVNGVGFWTLTKTNPTSHLNEPDDRFIRSDLYLAAMIAQETEGPLNEIVLMEYLPGPEISFDVLAHQGKLLKYAARTKFENGNQRIETDHFLGDAVKGLVERFNLHGVINTQFRKDNNGLWKCLEINSRPAGGVIYGEKVGAKILADWAGILTGRITPDEIFNAQIHAEIRIVNTIEEVSILEAIA